MKPLLWAAALSAWAGSAVAAEPAPKRGGTLVFAVSAEPGNYDCHGAVSFAFIHPVAPHYSTLLKFDLANYPQITGDLAQSWTVSADKLTYTFKLRPGVLFHDGSPLTAEDVAASYRRIAAPPAGVVSARQADYSAIASIDVPDPLTVVFHLQWQEAAMPAAFASPWNCIYNAAKLGQDPQYPKTNVLGTGAFAFVEHQRGKFWKGRRWNNYFLPGRPYLDGYEADFLSGSAMIKAFQSGKIAAEFRSVTPVERDELVRTMGDRVTFQEAAWIDDLIVVFNAAQRPFDDARVRRALSLAIDRWDMAKTLADTTFLKFPGGLMRPGSAFSAPEALLDQLPGFSRDHAASVAEAKRLLAEAGTQGLRLILTNRDVPTPYGPAADAVLAAWREIGVEAEQEKLNTRDWQAKLESGKFAVAFDFSGDYFDDPTLQLTKYVSADLSPVNFAHSTDRLLDSLFIGQAITADPRRRARIVRDFERRALEQAYTVPVLWWNRIVALSARVKGWRMSPSHFIGQDLTEVWLED